MTRGGAADAELVTHALAGDAEAFCALARRYQDHVYAVAAGVLLDFDLARDAAQEAFLCAWCNLPKLRNVSRFGAWLRGIARNTALEIRRDKRRQESLAAGLAAQCAGGTVSPPADQPALDAEQRRQIRAALARLGDNDREALTLYYADGLSCADICLFLDISQASLKGRLQRGRAALRRELAMVEQACKSNAPGDDFAARLAQAITVFSTKGPPRSHIPSPWHAQLREQTSRILSGGDVGLRISQALSHAGTRRLRRHAAAQLGLRGDAAGRDELQRMLADRSARVRRAAIRWFARAIAQQAASHGPSDAPRPAHVVPADVDRIAKLAADENFNVRLSAVQALGAHAGTGDPRIVEALRRALDDPKHKVGHAAARALRTTCRGCGRTWPSEAS